ncbi:hypothetical protein PGH47_42840 (plasmid) [Streptomyces sp. HUAS 31]|uniref:hypothetical protein n=1 Tax=Streptomyces TaxID=1883 RepID=UPI002306839A|nr:hypothetical protein [Streptomyces sp. HUAS 31]WCE02486.1 hypothetical protein PGH47_42840 [Streptomyces sp. HUAS 31]
MLALLLVSSTLLTAPSAQAEETWPTDAELLAKCDNGTKKCVFHPSGPMVQVPGETRRVGDEAYNCTSRTQRSGVTWSDTVGESNSLGLAMTVGVGFGGPWSLSITTSYETTWKTSKTESETTFIDVRPGHIGWLTRTPDMQRVKGTYELIFKDRFRGKRYWYVPFEATGPMETSNMTQRTRPMTDEERDNHC